MRKPVRVKAFDSLNADKEGKTKGIVTIATGIPRRLKVPFWLINASDAGGAFSAWTDTNGKAIDRFFETWHGVVGGCEILRTRVHQGRFWGLWGVLTAKNDSALSEERNFYAIVDAEEVDGKPRMKLWFSDEFGASDDYRSVRGLFLRNLTLDTFIILSRLINFEASPSVT